MSNKEIYLSDYFKPQGYDTKFIVYKNGLIKLRKFKQPIFNVSNLNRKSRSSSHEEGNISRESLSRTRRNIIDTIACNEEKFVSFITLTFAENITDPKIAYSYLRKFLRRVKDYMKKHDKEFYYIFIPEIQKRGAIHFHGLTNIELGSSIIPQRKKLKVRSKGKCRILEYYDIPFWSETIRSEKYSKTENNSLGYSTAIAIKKEFEEFSIGLYMSKYLTKDMSNVFFGCQKVLKSRNLFSPIVHKLTTTKQKEKDMIENFELSKKDNLISVYSQKCGSNGYMSSEYEEKTYKIDGFDEFEFEKSIAVAFGVEWIYEEKEHDS